MLGQGLDELEGRRPDERLQPLRDGVVVEGVFDAVGGGGRPGIRGHVDVEHDRLANCPLPVVNADHGVDAQFAQKHDVHPVWPFAVTGALTA